MTVSDCRGCIEDDAGLAGGSVCGTGVAGTIIDGVGGMAALSGSKMSSSSMFRSGGSGPRSSSSWSVKLVDAFFSAAISWGSGAQSSNPKAARICSAVARIVVAPLRIQACFPG